MFHTSHILHILHILHIVLFTSTLICPYYLLTGFYLSDDEEMPEDPPATANYDQLSDSPVQQPEISRSCPFDFHGAMTG
jgi:hypothetical protein